jgi:hypothetical protein
MIIFQISCYPEKERVITISGKLIDSPLNNDLSKYELTARSIFGATEKNLCSTYLDSQGNFTMQYSVSGTYVGNNLRISVYPLIGAQQKLEFLTYGESWNKNFYIGDSSKVVIKLIGDYTKIDTLRLFTDIGNILFKGPLSSNTLGTFRFGNYNQYVYYRYNPNNKFVYYEATGDPIIDTITLDINP